MEFSQTSSTTHFEVLGLGLAALGPRKLPCHRLKDSTIFWTNEISLGNAKNLVENLRRPFLYSFSGDSLKKCFEDLFFVWKKFFKTFFFSFFGEHLRLCPWFLALASRISVLGRGLGFFCVLRLGLGLEPCVLDSTSVFLLNNTKNRGNVRKYWDFYTTAYSAKLVSQLYPCIFFFNMWHATIVLGS